MSTKTRLFTGVLLAGLTLAQPALADVAALTSPAPGSMLAVDGNISFTIRDGAISPDRLNNVFVQFDGDDVTSLVAMNGLTVTYDPPQRLSAGEHRLLLIEKQADGTFAQLQSWTFRVGGGVAGAAVEGTFQGQYRYLLSDNLQGDEKIKPHSGNAALTAKASAGGQTWDTSATFNGFFDSKSENNQPDEDHFELGEYLLSMRHSGDAVNTWLRAGNHDTGISNLLVDQYMRRGASAQFDIGQWATLTGFAQDPARAIGNGNVTGFAREDQRAEGVTARAYAFPSTYGKRIFAEAGMYEGQGRQQGDGTVPAANPAEEGDGWVVAAEAQSLDDKKNIRGEFSEVNFDADGAGAVVQEDREAAWRARLQYAPIATLNSDDGATEKWLLQALYQRVGTFYRSLTNAGLPQDENRVTLTSQYIKDTLGFNAEGYFVENNTDEVVALPTDRGQGLMAQLTLTPAFLWKDTDPASFLGRSVWNAGGSYAHEWRHDTPVGFGGPGLDQNTWSANAGWAVAYDRWNLSLGHTWTEFDSEASGINYTRSNFTELSATWMPSDRFSITPTAQVQVTKDKIQHTTQQYFAGIDTAWTVIPEKLSHTFHWSSVFDDGTAADNQQVVSTEFTWQLNQPAYNTPGFALALSGDYERGGPVNTAIIPPIPSATKDENYKVFLSLKVTAPFGF